MDRGEDLAALARHMRPGVGELVLAQDATRDRLAVDVVHHDVGRADSVGAVAARDHVGHRHAGRGRRRATGRLRGPARPTRPRAGPSAGSGPARRPVNDHVSRLAPPERRRSPSIARCIEDRARARMRVLRSAVGPQRAVGVHGRTVARMDLEMQMRRTASGVAARADVADDLALRAPDPSTPKRLRCAP